MGGIKGGNAGGIGEGDASLRRERPPTSPFPERVGTEVTRWRSGGEGGAAVRPVQLGSPVRDDSTERPARVRATA